MEQIENERRDSDSKQKAGVTPATILLTIWLVVLTGILAAETATSITLRQQGGKEAVIARSEIDELRSSGQSLMPEGLERNIPPQDMADLLMFIKHWRYLDGRTPLSESQ